MAVDIGAEIKKLLDRAKSGKNKKEMLILAGAFFALFIVVYFYIFYRPAIVDLKKVMPEISFLSRQLNDAVQDIENRPLLEKKEKTLRAKIEFYEKHLPTEREIPKLLENLSDLATQSNVKILSITPVMIPAEESETQPIYKEIPINVEAKCGFHQMGELFQKLEHGDRFMKISGITINADTSDIFRHRLRFGIRTYTLAKEE